VLLILILIAWLTVMIVCIALCAMAARGDSTKITRDAHKSSYEPDGAETRVAAASGANPLELLLSDEREAASRRPLTGHGAR
jgi:hypothetical protein